MDDESENDGQGPNAFGRALRAALQRRGMSLRALQTRLRDRGHEVSIASLSLWQSGARRPSTDSSADIVRELEDLLGLDDDELAGMLRPHRRVPPDRNVPFADFVGLEHNSVTDESSARQLSERSSTLMSYVDATGRLTRNVARNVWQARVDGAQEVAAFLTVEPEEVAPPQVRGLIGCELSDVVIDMEQRVMRVTVRLNAPLLKGDMALAEWESFDHRYEPDAVSDFQGLVAVRPEAEVGVFIYFDPEHLPRRCLVSVETDDTHRVFSASPAGACVSHIEYDFGPGMISVEWEW